MEVGSRRWKDQSNTSERRDRSAGSVVEAVVEVEDIANLQLVTVATGIPLLSGPFIRNQQKRVEVHWKEVILI